MNTAAISALAALGGSAIGALAPVLTNVLVQRSAARRDLANRTVAAREALYSDFIKEASGLFVTAVTHDLENLGDLVYALRTGEPHSTVLHRSRMHAAEDVVKRITAHFSEREPTYRAGCAGCCLRQGRSTEYVQFSVSEGAERYCSNGAVSSEKVFGKAREFTSERWS